MRTGQPRSAYASAASSSGLLVVIVKLLGNDGDTPCRRVVADLAVADPRAGIDVRPRGQNSEASIHSVSVDAQVFGEVVRRHLAFLDEDADDAIEVRLLPLLRRLRGGRCSRPSHGIEVKVRHPVLAI